MAINLGPFLNSFEAIGIKGQGGQGVKGSRGQWVKGQTYRVWLPKEWGSHEVLVKCMVMFTYIISVEHFLHRQRIG